jgi:hypothetical protein
MLEADDVVVLSERTTGALLTALLVPTGMNYPGKPRGVFEVSFDRAAMDGLRPDDYDLLLARPRTHEVWRLKAR